MIESSRPGSWYQDQGPDSDLSDNNLGGPIPHCLADSLETLFLQKNNFSGTIPQTYPKECDLRMMDMSQNQLTGKVPKSLSNCKMLQVLDLSNNQMKQTFPTWLGTLPRLQVLLLHFNMFHGLGSGLVVGFVMGDISMDRHPWLIRGIVQKFGLTEETENA
uniref:Leucine-rich repeat-containing N-terminal plant-type domain-containing protein n=1 Tax=Daucus carota subsp. sativus TaxID=79200 RepID=A0A164ZUZ1_DAUCS